MCYVTSCTNLFKPVLKYQMCLKPEAGQAEHLWPEPHI